jgi:hypothetical protein
LDWVPCARTSPTCRRSGSAPVGWRGGAAMECVPVRGGPGLSRRPSSHGASAPRPWRSRGSSVDRRRPVRPAGRSLSVSPRRALVCAHAQGAVRICWGAPSLVSATHTHLACRRAQPLTSQCPGAHNDGVAAAPPCLVRVGERWDGGMCGWWGGCAVRVVRACSAGASTRRSMSKMCATTADHLRSSQPGTAADDEIMKSCMKSPDAIFCSFACQLSQAGSGSGRRTRICHKTHIHYFHDI